LVKIVHFHISMQLASQYFWCENARIVRIQCGKKIDKLSHFDAVLKCNRLMELWQHIHHWKQLTATKWYHL